MGERGAAATRQAEARPKREHRLGVPFALVAAVIVFGSLLGNVVFQTAILQTRLQLDDVNGRLVEAREQNRRLRLTVMELESPDRVLAGAVDGLGMVRPDARRYLPGVDPTIDSIRQPEGADPFGPGPLPDFLREPEPEDETARVSDAGDATNEAP